ncbi:sensor histidine kinase [Paenibacillus thalictri]|uniref:GHKL domain-containing protein n=1 Tax=Paenibacillus thalictri TaxID=2527873 RepID=A0A4Q9DPE0_9BACL|nr:ATP-binding protein [Paenibacillus thalictri]TBL75650.1 GHKL domain-containing protein [Paenibacillus thalictri]
MNRGESMDWLQRIPLKTSLVFLVVLMALNMAYYKHSKYMMFENEKMKIQMLYNSVITHIEQSAKAEKIVEDLIGQNLRTAAIAARYKLDPDIDKISNAELVELSKQLGVDNITLFKKTEDDIVGMKSSDEHDLNVSSKGWDTIHTALQQLFHLQEVKVGMGQTLPYFWSEPFDTSSSNPQIINKWGFYYDGSTNYIIDPFVSNKSFFGYQNLIGLNDMIRRLVEQNKQAGLEIAVLNTNKLLERKMPSAHPIPDNWFSERLVLFGQYEYRDQDEKRYAQLALNSGKTVYYQTVSGTRPIFKSFSPVQTSYVKYNPAGEVPLIEISSDYSQMNQMLNQRLNETLWFMAFCSCLCLIVLGLIFIGYSRNKKNAVRTVQDSYTESMEMLFQSIREQRHDFINHIQTIHGFLAIKQYGELEAYTKSLVGEIRLISGLVDINNPPLIALLQAKLSQAEQLDIRFEHRFSHMDKLKLQAIKATDVVKILSNLIDNAFDAAMEFEPERRFVRVEGEVAGDGLVKLTVSNSGKPISDEIRQQLFQSGFTTKNNGVNSGLGLHIVHQLVKRYKGDIQLHSEDGVTAFIVSIPLS